MKFSNDISDNHWIVIMGINKEFCLSLSYMMGKSDKIVCYLQRKWEIISGLFVPYSDIMGNKHICSLFAHMWCGIMTQFVISFNNIRSNNERFVVRCTDILRNNYFNKTFHWYNGN